MRKLIVSTYTTLDGAIQPLDWLGQNQRLEAQQERGAFARELLFSSDALLLGRETYEIFADVWASRTSADDGPGEEGCVDRINSLPKYVASTTLRAPLRWNATLLENDIPANVARLKSEPGGAMLVYGCGRLARTLLEHGLVDEFQFWVYPVLRGGGTPLFEGRATSDLELIDSRTFKGGFIVLTCRPKQDA